MKTLLEGLPESGHRKLKDNSVEFFTTKTGDTFAYIEGKSGYPVCYPLPKVPVVPIEEYRGILMDLDGTTLDSEPFWMLILEMTVGSVTGKKNFSFSEEDVPYICGHSVTEHLTYCLETYGDGDISLLSKAVEHYYIHTRREMKEVMAGKGLIHIFRMPEDVKEFLIRAKEKNKKLGLVTSGLYEKAYPEIYAAFQMAKMGKPEEFYDCILTAGTLLEKGVAGTLGELEAKPHPWMYAEALVNGFGMTVPEGKYVLAIEDSSSGICSARLAGLCTIGLEQGNIRHNDAQWLCHEMAADFNSLMKYVNLG